MFRPRAKLNATLALAALMALVASCTVPAQAGCPFDDGSCQQYCNQQGCNFGYCGNFAWIQCICRRCGDEWNWYDKVHYNPDKQVNQTELDSLKLNVSGPLILTNSNTNKAPLAPPVQQVVGPVVASPAAAATPVKQQAEGNVTPPKQQQPTATLTTLLIPDLSDSSKLDLNDIPDENSEKFLDYLAKNHEKLAQATNGARGGGAQQAPSPTSLADDTEDQPEPEAGDDESSQQQDAAASKQPQPQQQQQDEPVAEETVEIQISSSNNQQQQQQQAAKRQQPQQSPAQASDDEEDDEEQQQQQQQSTSGGAVTRLLKMAVAERSSDDIF